LPFNGCAKSQKVAQTGFDEIEPRLTTGMFKKGQRGYEDRY